MRTRCAQPTLKSRSPLRFVSKPSNKDVMHTFAVRAANGYTSTISLYIPCMFKRPSSFEYSRNLSYSWRTSRPRKFVRRATIDNNVDRLEFDFFTRCKLTTPADVVTSSGRLIPWAARPARWRDAGVATVSTFGMREKERERPRSPRLTDTFFVSFFRSSSVLGCFLGARSPMLPSAAL